MIFVAMATAMGEVVAEIHYFFMPRKKLFKVFHGNGINLFVFAVAWQTNTASSFETFS